MNSLALQVPRICAQRSGAMFAEQSQRVSSACGMVRVICKRSLVERHAMDAIFAGDNCPATRWVLRQKNGAGEMELLHDHAKLRQDWPAHHRIGLLVNQVETRTVDVADQAAQT